MKTYNGSGNHGVVAYEFRSNGIVLQFRDGSLYLYDDDVPGPRHVDEMKIRAEAGAGLTTYVNRHVRENYKEKL